MADNQAQPTVDDKINALTDLVSKLAKQVSGMVSHRAMRRADEARGDDDDRKDAKADDDDRKDWDEDEKAKKDAARDTLFGKRDAKRDDGAKADEDEDEEKEKEAKDDAAKADEDEDEDEKEHKDDTAKADEGGEPEPMASDDDRRKDRKKDASKSDDDKRDDAAKADNDRHDRADARADSMIRKLQREISDLRSSIRRPRPQTDDELNAIAERQQEWDRVAQMHGQRASRPLDGERIESYDRRLAKTFQKHSVKWKDADLSQVPIELVTKVIAPEIRADAISAAYRVEPSEGGMLREVRKPDRTGRIISEFVGPVDAVNGALAPFRMPRMRVRDNRINTQPNQF